MTDNKLTAKQKHINAILAMENNNYSATDCESMKVAELKELLADLKKEAATPEPELNEDGTITVHETPAEVVEEVEKTKRAPKEGGSKREVLFAVFDKANEANEDLKKAAREASPETSDGVIASYLCYWRKDRGIAATRGFGNTAPKLSNAQRVLKKVEQVYGEGFDIEAVIAELQAAMAQAEEKVEEVEETETAE